MIMSIAARNGPGLYTVRIYIPTYIGRKWIGVEDFVASWSAKVAIANKLENSAVSVNASRVSVDRSASRSSSSGTVTVS